MTCHWVCKKSKMTGVTSETGIDHSSGTPEINPGFQWGLCHSILSFLWSFMEIIFFFILFWPLYCLFFFDLWLLITPLVSSNFSSNILIYRTSIPLQDSIACTQLLRALSKSSISGVFSCLCAFLSVLIIFLFRKYIRYSQTLFEFNGQHYAQIILRWPDLTKAMRLHC